jgi:diacylglycerol kinase (ATP)
MKYLLLYNPVSGRSKFKSHLAYIEQEFKNAHHELMVYESKAPKDLLKVAEEEAANYDVFLVAGGDGTINEVVNGMMHAEKQPALAILPSGTANDIAAIIGINKNIKKSLKILFSETPVFMDLNQINDQYFVYTAASGILSRVSYDISRRHLKKYGYIAYVIEAMKDLTQEYRYPIKIKYNNEHLSCECVMILGLSSNRVGGMRLINFSSSKLNDGLFELRLFTRAKSLWRFRLLSSLIRGGKQLREDHHLVSSRYEIETSSNVRWNADGEYSCNGNIIIQTHKEKLKIYVNPKIKKKMF